MYFYPSPRRILRTFFFLSLSLLLLVCFQNNLGAIHVFGKTITSSINTSTTEKDAVDVGESSIRSKIGKRSIVVPIDDEVSDRAVLIPTTTTDELPKAPASHDEELNFNEDGSIGKMSVPDNHTDVPSCESGTASSYAWVLAFDRSTSDRKGNITLHDVSFCGGSLVDSEWVLTAAHCVGVNMFIYVGPKNLVKGHAELMDEFDGMLKSSSDGKVRFEPDSDSWVEITTKHVRENVGDQSNRIATVDEDIALLKLKHPVREGKCIKYMTLFGFGGGSVTATEDVAGVDQEKYFKQCKVIGHGGIDDSGTLAPKLQQMGMNLKKKCSVGLNKGALCAVPEGDNPNTPMIESQGLICGGDSGSLLACEYQPTDTSDSIWFQVGVVSKSKWFQKSKTQIGNMCTSETVNRNLQLGNIYNIEPNTMQDVGFYQDWIKSHCTRCQFGNPTYLPYVDLTLHDEAKALTVVCAEGHELCDKVAMRQADHVSLRGSDLLRFKVEEKNRPLIFISNNLASLTTSEDEKARIKNSLAIDTYQLHKVGSKKMSDLVTPIDNNSQEPGDDKRDPLEDLRKHLEEEKNLVLRFSQLDFQDRKIPPASNNSGGDTKKKKDKEEENDTILGMNLTTFLVVLFVVIFLLLAIFGLIIGRVCFGGSTRHKDSNRPSSGEQVSLPTSATQEPNPQRFPRFLGQLHRPHYRPDRSPEEPLDISQQEQFYQEQDNNDHDVYFHADQAQQHSEDTATQGRTTSNSLYDGREESSVVQLHDENYRTSYNVNVVPSPSSRRVATVNRIFANGHSVNSWARHHTIQEESHENSTASPSSSNHNSTSTTATSGVETTNWTPVNNSKLHVRPTLEQKRGRGGYYNVESYARRTESIISQGRITAPANSFTPLPVVNRVNRMADSTTLATIPAITRSTSCDRRVAGTRTTTVSRVVDHNSSPCTNSSSSSYQSDTSNLGYRQIRSSSCVEGSRNKMLRSSSLGAPRTTRQMAKNVTISSRNTPPLLPLPPRNIDGKPRRCMVVENDEVPQVNKKRSRIIVESL